MQKFILLAISWQQRLLQIRRAAWLWMLCLQRRAWLAVVAAGNCSLLLCTVLLPPQHQQPAVRQKGEAAHIPSSSQHAGCRKAKEGGTVAPSLPEEPPLGFVHLFLKYIFFRLISVQWCRATAEL